jgi:hypothetical protein
MEYTAPAHKAPPVDGYILQAPACDADAFELEMGHDQIEESIKTAKKLIDAGKGHERMTLTKLPGFMRDTPISAWRWYALAAPEYVRDVNNFQIPMYFI